LSVSKKTHVRVFFDSFFPVRFLAKRYMLQQKCLMGQIGIACWEHTGTTFSAVHRPWEPQCTALQTHGRPDDANSRSYCV